MAEPYRLYLLDAAGHITKAEWIDAGSDAEAIATATQRARSSEQDGEVWQLTRKVGQITTRPQTFGITAD